MLIVSRSSKAWCRPEVSSVSTVITSSRYQWAVVGVALTGLGLGSVGRYLKILLGAHLIQRRRAGRPVPYFRTQPGNTL